MEIRLLAVRLLDTPAILAMLLAGDIYILLFTTSRSHAN